MIRPESGAPADRLIPYRREIDGLRAIAVSAVVLYHAGLGPAAGYVGVDIFFVISGFLITALLLGEYSREGRIGLADFYARRIRRILPASVVVILFALLVSFLVLPPSLSQPVAQSAAAASIFIANVFFQVTTSGYFSPDTGQLPLLHLWSLSVEEQFYLVWPALLMLLLNIRIRLVPTLSALALASFVLAVWLMRSNPGAAFHQMPARFWELAAGGLIAAMPAHKLPGWTAWAGLMLAVTACFFPLPSFPGWGALPAVAGSALLLAAIKGGATNVILASRPFVGVGLISYSLYLWHWPLLAFDRLLRIGEPPLSSRLAIVTAALVLAFATYRYVETPLRRPWGSSRRTVTTGLAMMLVLAVSAWTWKRPMPENSGPAEVVEVNPNYPQHCHPYTAGKPAKIQPPLCLREEPKVAIWGDSYAHAWTPMALALADKLKLPAVTLALDGCPPLLGAKLALRSPAEAVRCGLWNKEVVGYLEAYKADTVILTARWQNFIEADGGKTSAEGLVRAVDAISPHVRRILIIAPTPEFPDTPQKCAALGLDCWVSRAEFLSKAAPAWELLRVLELHPKVEVTDPAGWLCGPEKCPAIRDGVALYSDQAHVSNEAALVYASQVAPTWH